MSVLRNIISHYDQKDKKPDKRTRRKLRIPQQLSSSELSYEHEARSLAAQAAGKKALALIAIMTS